MARTISLVQQVRIASPCTADWNSMRGDERVRFCGECRLHVYDLSEMTDDAAANLIREHHGHLCVRLFRRHDGTVLTKDCPVGLAAVRRRLRRLVTAAAALLSIVSGAFALTRSSDEGAASYSSIGDVPGVRTVKRWLDPAPPALAPIPRGGFVMGRMATPAAALNGTAPATPADACATSQ